MRNIIIVGLILVSIVLVIVFVRQLQKEEANTIPKLFSSQGDEKMILSLAKNLEIPWALDFTPEGNIIFTERPGRVRIIDKEEGLDPKSLLSIPDIAAIGEGGLLGLTLHPDFGDNNLVYLYYTYQEGEEIFNKVVRMRFEDEKLTDQETILERIPGSLNHNGGRIKFGPDGFLYITTGDAQDPDLSQDKNSLAGKILRIKDDGLIPEDNPFDNAVYSLGHRNPQGLAWNKGGKLFATEHGPSGRDEVNLIEKGKNYGWPTIKGNQTELGLENPIIHSGSDTWAPAGAVFWESSIFFGGLRGQSLFEMKEGNGTFSLEEHLQGQFGRIRDVVLGPDGYLYITTSNRDGRGSPKGEDDQIIRISPQNL